MMHYSSERVEHAFVIVFRMECALCGPTASRLWEVTNEANKTPVSNVVSFPDRIFRARRKNAV